MPLIDFDAERAYDDKRFSAQETFRTERTKVVCAYFEPGQFIPVHAPGSDVVVNVRRGTGVVREDKTTHKVSPGDTVAVEAGTDRGIRADEDGRLEALLVTTPPPTDEEHGPVREGLRRGVFDPTADDSE
ncbi:cupin domain-containing protein [Halobaculum limi]|uniref:cupin domain-containing protein n=1 Tax=Halobaculum limi TaxID=3031916 RepID=UPI0024056976|nr:cupin domain-containing protein [Halobaculum sp. YSMS11]